jgi:hypothetical protein
MAERTNIKPMWLLNWDAMQQYTKKVDLESKLLDFYAHTLGLVKPRRSISDRISPLQKKAPNGNPSIRGGETDSRRA